MLTGMVAPTEGYATVAGKDIRSQLNQIRGDIGICLQHDCLFPYLTVKEHIQFFARIKGQYAKKNGSEVEEDIKASIEDVALTEKSNTLSSNLSGGMKRKLSVAIAFCGGSKTVYVLCVKGFPGLSLLSSVHLIFHFIALHFLGYSMNPRQVCEGFPGLYLLSSVHLISHFIYLSLFPLLLHQPSSGMDPFSRRFTWNVSALVDFCGFVLTQAS